jgi:hypothetical protein
LKLGRNIEKCRTGHPTLKCESFTSTDSKTDCCPVFVPLRNKLPDWEKDCPSSFDTKHNHEVKGIFWSTIRDGFVRYNQATYFEIMFIQFFILSLLTPSNGVHLASLVAACCIFLFPYLLLTYFQEEPLPLFEDRNMRLLAAISVWLIVVGLATIAI